MKAWICPRYGPPDILRLEDVPKPVAGEREVLVRIHTTTVTSADARVRGRVVPTGFGLIMRLALGVRRPRQPILGNECSGTVEAVGSKVERFKPGDQVIASSDIAMGCHAEYRVLPETAGIIRKPAELSFEQAAALSFGGTTVLHFFRKADLKPGERILINGASGAVGSAAVQLAKHFGAHVTAVCSGANIGLVRSIGADEAIDYTTDDFTANGQTYDLIMDTIGTAPYGRSKASLAKGGRLLLVIAGLPALLAIPFIALGGGPKVVAGPATIRVDDLQLLADLAAKGIYRPVIDRTYPFEQMVEAHRYVDTGRKKGNVAVTVRS